MKKHLFLISLDAVSSDDIDFLIGAPFFGRILKKSVLVKNVDSVFLSNTYPAHTSIITGVTPSRHGVMDNVIGSSGVGGRKQHWRWHKGNIKSPTLFDEAKKAGLTTCSIFWPVTASADITYNMPEIFDTENAHKQLFTSLMNGNAFYQLEMLGKYFRKFYPIAQRGVDKFTSASAAETIRKYKPNLLMLHLFDMDEVKHKHGNDPDYIKNSLLRLDEKLRAVYNAAEACGILEDSLFIFTGDHAQLDVHTRLNLNDDIAEVGSRAYFHNTGGTCFLKLVSCEDSVREAVQRITDSYIERGLIRTLTGEEMAVCGGAERYDCGFEAADGYFFGAKDKKGAHGYTLGRPDYKTFYMVCGLGNTRSIFADGGSIMDICPLAAKILGVAAWDMDGRINRVFARWL